MSMEAFFDSPLFIVALTCRREEPTPHSQQDPIPRPRLPSLKDFQKYFVTSAAFSPIRNSIETTAHNSWWGRCRRTDTRRADVPRSKRLSEAMACSWISRTALDQRLCAARHHRLGCDCGVAGREKQLAQPLFRLRGRLQFSFRPVETSQKQFATDGTDWNSSQPWRKQQNKTNSL